MKADFGNGTVCRFQNEVDLGNDISITFQYDDSPEAFEAKEKMMKSAQGLGYTIITENEYVIHVVNTPKLEKIGYTILHYYCEHFPQ